MIKNKKGASQLWWIIMVAVIAIVAAILLTVWFRTAGGKVFGDIGGRLDQLGDCDKDRVANMFDKCPCISTLGVEHSTLRGCPKDYEGSPMTPERASADAKACDDKKCGEVETAAVQVSEGAAEGIGTKGDLTITEIKFFDGNTEITKKDRYNVQLSGKNDFSLGIELKIKNVGTENILQTIQTGIEICNANKKECAPGADNSLKAWSTSGLDESKDVSLAKKNFRIGADGDHCDGAGDTECYIKIKVDSDNKFTEGPTKESNNEKWFYISLSGQTATAFSGEKYQSIEIFADEGESGYEGEILKMCSGFIGKDCASEEGDCDGAGEHRTTLLSSGCLIHASEDNDVVDNACGYAGAKEGKVISMSRASTIPLTGSVTESDGSGAKDLFGYKWKAKKEGSLLCANKLWHLCDDGRQNQLVVVGGVRHKCDNRKWS